MRFTQVFTVDLQLTAPILMNIAKFQLIQCYFMARRSSSSVSLVSPASNKRPRRSRVSTVYEENIDFTIGTTNAEELADKRTEEKDR